MPAPAPPAVPHRPLRRSASPAAYGTRDEAAADLAVVARAQREPSPQARHAAAERFLPLTRSLARRYKRGSEPLDDLEQVASLGLMKAINGFDLGRGAAFRAFAVPTIVGELRRHFRDKGWTIRVPRDLQETSQRVARSREAMTGELGRSPTVAELAGRLEVPCERVLEASAAQSAMLPASLDRPLAGADEDSDATLLDSVGGDDAGYARVEAGAVAERLMTHLPERDRRVVRMRFGEDLTQSEIAARVGVSQMQVSRILRRSLERLSAVAEQADSPEPALT